MELGNGTGNRQAIFRGMYVSTCTPREVCDRYCSCDVCGKYSCYVDHATLKVPCVVRFEHRKNADTSTRSLQANTPWHTTFPLSVDAMSRTSAKVSSAFDVVPSETYASQPASSGAALTSPHSFAT